jgi:aldehyde dehydrogenase (NAD+)
MIQDFEQIVASQRRFFLSGETKSYEFRVKALKRLKQALIAEEKALYEALWLDLRKSEKEAYLTELGILNQEINNHLNSLQQWMSPKKATTPLYLLPSRYEVQAQPLGVCLILSPWNYPVQLTLNPLIGAISAGCCALLKPSPKTPHVNAILKRIIEASYPKEYIHLVLGDATIYEPLLKVRYDLIFFTGSTRVGKIVMKAAADHLCPVILELGGKNPCLIHQDADLKKAAKRIVWGKCLNAGQTCIAPDFLLIHESVLNSTIKELQKAYSQIHEGSGGKEDLAHFGKIIDDTAFERLQEFCTQGKILFQGKSAQEKNFLPFTLLRIDNANQPVMQEEIFGPILPILTYSDLEQEITKINQNERPLAAYFFGGNRAAEVFKNKVLSGGIGINDTILQIANDAVPFGGVGHSGIGAYHGKFSFDAFSHHQTVITTPTWLDLPFRYPPFKYFKLIKRFLG